MKKIYWILIPGMILVGSVLVLLFIQIKRVGDALSLIQTTVVQTDDEILSTQQAVLQIADDLNEARKFVGLSESRYEVIQSLSDSETEESPYFLAIEKLLHRIDENNAIDTIHKLKTDKDFQKQLQRFSLLPSSDTSPLLSLMQDDRFAMSIRAKSNTGYEITFPDGSTDEVPTFEEMRGQFFRILEKATQQLRTFIQLENELIAFFSLPSTIELLVSREISSAAPLFQERGIHIPVLRKNEVVAQVQFHIAPLSYEFQDQRFDSFIAFQRDFPRLIANGKFMSQEEHYWEQALTQIRGSLHDPAFTEYLRVQGLEISRDERDDGEHIFFDLLLLSTGEKAGSFAIQRSSKQLWIFDADEVPISSLQTLLLSQTETPTVPVGEFPDTTVFLLSGLREQLADTMILAFANMRTQQLQFISIPRDLFYKGRKINQLYRRYGSQRFTTEMEKITGIDIQHYVLIDMYAFIEVVDLLGGIDITLHEPLIDPTYKVRVGTTWSTLYYPAGEYHLNGIEALRVVRSRHTTDDFDRASRQQQILLAIKTALSKIRLSDVGKLYQLVLIVNKYVTTDLNPFQIINYIAAYENLKIQSQRVLSTDNILYTTYSNLYYMGKTIDEVDPLTFDKGAWILLPQNNDWSKIHGFLKEFVKG